jgi:general secretion pathway protein D
VLSRNTPLIDETLRNQHVRLSEFSSEIIQQLADAKRMTQEQRRPDAALDLLYNLKRRVEQTQHLDSPTKQMYVQQIDRAIENTISFRDRYSAQSRQNQINQEVLDQLRHEAEAFRLREEQLAAMFREHKKLLDEQRYEEALRVARRAKEIAPDEPAVQVMLTLSQLAFNVHRSHDIRGLKQEGWLNAMMDAERGSIVPDFSRSTMIYPDPVSWRDLTQRRQTSNQALQQQRPETERRIVRQLDVPVSLNVNQPLTLEQALHMLCRQVDLDVYIDRAALQEADIQTGIMVTMPSANGIRMRSVLNTILDQHGLAWVVKNEMLNITTKRRSQGEKYPRMHYVGDIVNEVPVAQEVNPMEDAMWRAWMLQTQHVQNTRSATNTQNMPMQQGMNGFPTSGNMIPNTMENDPNFLAQWGGGGMGGMGGGMGGMGSGFGGGMGGMSGMGGGMMGGMGMNFADIQSIIMSVIEPDSWMDGDAFMSFHYATQSLAIRQTEEVHAQIEDLLNQIRKMNDLQVAVEVRYITLSDSFFERMGLSFDAVFRNDGAFAHISQSQHPITGSDGTQVAATTSRGNNVTVGLRAPGEFTVDASIPIYQDSFGIAIPTFGGYNPAAGISTGFALLNDIETYFFLSAAQGDRRNSVMEAPKVMLQNGQMGSISDYTQIPFVTSVIPVVADFAAAYQPIITTLNHGNVLRVQATASNDRQSVRLTLNPTFTTLVRVDTFRFFGDDEQSEETQTTRGDDTSPITSDPRSTSRRTTTARSGITIQQPITATFSVSTTVTCPDGGTVLLGGIKRLSEGRIEAGTPILNKIPYIQRLFANTAIGRETQSIMIMVTPRIIIQEEEEHHIMGPS